MNKISEKEWNEINEAIAPTGLHYASKMACENCGKMTDRNKMVWVWVRTYTGTISEKWCDGCDTY